MKNAKKTSFIKLLGPYLVMGMIIGFIMVVLNLQGMTVNNLSTGKLLTALENNEVKKMMKKIAANAVCIGLYNFNRLVISHISEGDFTTIKPEWKDARVGMVKCLAIINNEGENLKDTLSLEEIEEAVRFTIFELETSEDDDE